MATTSINAAIDIGTNSILLLVAKKFTQSSPLNSKPSLVPLIDQAQTVRLGENLISTNSLSEQAIERTLTVLQTYLKAAKSYSPSKIVCFGTEALRRAKNSEVFCQRVNQELGLSPRILSPMEEAHYTFQGVLSSFNRSTQDTTKLVIDIGGGSTEIIYGTDSALTYQQSFPIGAVTTKEKFQIGVNGLHRDISNLQTYIRDFFQELPNISQETLVVLTGGTATTLAALDQRLTNYDIAAIDGYCMDYSAIERWYDQLAQISLEKRTTLKGMEAGRADIILPALLILITLLTILNIKRVQISIRGARYGILL
ncbi:MAG: hypothetical protein F6K11_01375 [Leptolyngbya sp. SIO3F4]|nr:hypothetical protein [Leptolyngbya sp. SIO3F4]